MKENILVIDRDVMFKVGYFEGICFEIDKYLQTINSHAYFKERYYAEKEYKSKQLVVYSIIFAGKFILSYKRGTASGESRLKGKHSIGIGGHISEDDIKNSKDKSIYVASLKREIAEEIRIERDFKHGIVGLINDDSNNVGKVHIGVLTAVRIRKPIIKIIDTSISEYQFLTNKELMANIGKYEKWSQLCILGLDRILIKSKIVRN